MKDAILFTEIRWSKWIESVRKDVECTFGILKGRFRILKIGVRVHTLESVDQLWCTCCALHIMFLSDDGLAENWEQDQRSDYEGELGSFANFDEISNADTDFSGMGSGNDRIVDNNINNEIDEATDTTFIDENNSIEGCTSVNSVPHDLFRSKLVDHFDILFNEQQIKWPTRTGTITPNI